MLHKAVMITATLTLGLGAVGIGITPSGAESGTHCTFQHVPNLNPGLSYKPSNGNFIDPGGGTADCKGAVSGSGSYTDTPMLLTSPLSFNRSMVFHKRSPPRENRSSA